MAMSFVTFIVPSVGRPSLSLALASLEAQGDQDWEAIVIFDGVRPTVEPHPKMKLIEIEKHGNPSVPRNEALKLVTSPWVGFVDDDDRLLSTYVERLKHHIDSAYEAILFSILLGGNRVYPPGNRLVCGTIAMSYAVNMDFIREKGVTFPNMLCEDFYFLKACKDKGARIKFTNEVQYIMRGSSYLRR